MENCILGLMMKNEEQEYKLDNKLTNHAKKRDFRLELINLKSKPIFYFEVYRFKDKSRQVHCILEDASVFVFNSKNKEIITYILLNRTQLDHYLKSFNCDSVSLSKLYKCAKLNEKFKVYQDNQLNEIDKKDYLQRKGKIIGRES